ncbi:hypothetical protein ACHAPJ_008220 [Fusarium lateritium]
MVKMLELRHLELGKRQATASTDTTFTLVISPDKTCGFLSGSPGNAITCGNGQKCSWELAHLTAIFCGETAYNRCIDRTDALNTKLCGDVCQSNSYNLLCTDRSAPYCGTYAYPSGVKGYRCATATLTRDQSADFTYNNQDNREFSTTLLSDELTSITSETSETSSVESTTTIPVTSTTEEPEPTETDDSDGGGSKTNVGAIVGGAIGGFVALSLVVLGAIWLWRRNKKPNDPPAEQPTSVPPPPPGPIPHPNIPEAPADDVPPMSQYYPKSGVGSPTQSEWRDSMITAQNPNSPGSTWTAPHSAGGQTTPYQGAPPNYNHPH